jgi:hypothetical protein
MLALVFAAPGVARAQYGHTPSFQVPRVSDRDYNFAVADGGGTTLLFQWREGTGSRTHLVFDAGLADPGGNAGVRIVLGGGFGFSVHSSNDEMPLDMVLTGGIGGVFGDGLSRLRIPFGLSVGHQFLLDSPVSITPYAHPRLALDYCSRCGPRARGESDLALDVDLGVEVGVSRRVALRASVLLAGSDSFGREDSFGVSLVWVPPGLR